MTVSHENRVYGTAACGADKRFRSPSTSKTRRSGSPPDMPGIALAPMSGVGPDSCHQNYGRSTPPPFTREDNHALCTTKVFVVGCPSRVSQGDEPRGMGVDRVTRTEFPPRAGDGGTGLSPHWPEWFPRYFQTSPYLDTPAFPRSGTHSEGPGLF